MAGTGCGKRRIEQKRRDGKEAAGEKRRERIVRREAAGEKWPERIVRREAAGEKRRERVMQTVADMIHALNELFLDFAPAVALIGLAVSWFFRNRQCRETERELRRRIDLYNRQGGPEAERGEPAQETGREVRESGADNGESGA